MTRFICNVTIGFFLLVASCGISQQKKERQAKPCREKFKITEIGIDSISLVELARNKSTLQNLFSCYRVEQFLAEQDGPTVKAIDVLSDKEENFFTIYLDHVDTTKISRAFFFSKKFYDEYGLKIGDKFTNIKQQRGDKVKWITDFDQTTYAYYEKSKIVYVISGDFNIEDQEDPEDIKFTEDQIQDWIIERIEWVNR